MNPSLAVGIALVAVVFGGAFVATARALGWRLALVVWGIAVVATAVVAFGAGLIEAGAAR